MNLNFPLDLDPQGCQASKDPLPLRPLRLPRHPDEQSPQAFQVQARRGGGGG